MTLKRPGPLFSPSRSPRVPCCGSCSSVSRIFSAPTRGAGRSARATSSRAGRTSSWASRRRRWGRPPGPPVSFPWVFSPWGRGFGPREGAVRLPSAILGLIGVIVLERVIRRGWGQPAGHLAGAFAALFPPLVAASRAATVEPTLVTLGLAGIIFGLRAFEEDSPFEGAVSGVFFGLGFLAKGYAVGLYLIPLLLALLARPRLFGLGRTKRALTLLGLAFVAVGFSHLFAID